MSLERKFKIDENIKNFGFSPFNKYMWCINTNDYLTIYNIEKEKIEKLNYYQKEIWDVKWCQKNEEEGRKYHNRNDNKSFNKRAFTIKRKLQI